MSDVKLTDDTMNIHAKPGDRVVFAFPNNGYPADGRRAAEHLTLGRAYTVERCNIHDFSTSVWLREVPGVSFNSVMFADAGRAALAQGDER